MMIQICFKHLKGFLHFSKNDWYSIVTRLIEMLIYTDACALIH